MIISLLIALAGVGLLAAAALQKSLILALLGLCLLAIALTTRLRGALQSTAMLATSFLVCWTALEGLLAFLEKPPAADAHFYEVGTEQPADYWQRHDAYGILPNEGVYRARKATPEGEVIYDAVYTIGPDGFRLPPEEQAVDGDPVYFIGGSATFGEGLNDDQTLPWHFGRQGGGRPVHNKAMSGWGLHQAYTVWREAILDPGATVIVQTAPWHADRAACMPKYSGLSPRYEMIGETLESAGRCRTWFGSQALSMAMIKSALLQRVYDIWNRERAEGKMDLYFAMLQAMDRLAAERGQCFVVAFNKARDDYLADTGYSNEAIADRLIELGLDVVDTTLAERKEDLDPIYFIAGDGHPTEAANEAKAALLTAAGTRCDRQLLSRMDEK